MSYHYINHMKAIGPEQNLKELIKYIAKYRYFDEIRISTNDIIDITRNPKTIQIQYTKKKEPYFTYEYESKYNIPHKTHEKLAQKFPAIKFEIESAGEQKGYNVEKNTYKNEKQQIQKYRNYSKQAICLAAKLWWEPNTAKYIEKSKYTNKYYISNEYCNQNGQNKDKEYYDTHCTLEYGT